jgi:pyruvate/2-oxoglutarate dehydrogenase complex dihydrolipoamide acyltransferase (E2) component
LLCAYDPRKRAGTHTATMSEKHPAATAADMRAAFRVFDKDGSGTLSADEMTAILTRKDGGHALALEDAKKLIARFDKNGDGVLDFEEFVEAWSTRSAPKAAASKAAALTPAPVAAAPTPAPVAAAPVPSAAPAYLQMMIELKSVIGTAPNGSTAESAVDGGSATINAPGFTMTLAKADEKSPEDVSEATVEFMDEVDSFEDLTPEKLSDGWIFTATASDRSKIWVRGRRQFGSNAYSAKCEVGDTAAKDAAIEVIKSLACL